MEELLKKEWLSWESVKQAWDEITVQYMTNSEKMKALGKPVHAFYGNGYDVEQVAFYYSQCDGIYPQWMIDSSIQYYQGRYYPELRKRYEEYKSDTY